jgi:hypothetical protein
MSGRGDNNKHGGSGRGASNQSNQAFIADGKNQPKSNHGDQTGGKPSRPKPKKEDASANRDHAKKK